MKIEADQFDAISYIFEMANGNNLGNYETRIIDTSKVKGVSPVILVNAIIESFKEANPGDISYRTSAYWALSKRFDKKLIPFFQKQLELELTIEGIPAVFQLLIALDNLTEPVFGKDRNGSYAGMDIELNMRDAKNYLKQRRVP